MGSGDLLRVAVGERLLDDKLLTVEEVKGGSDGGIRKDTRTVL
jgi:hypothetical protein